MKKYIMATGTNTKLLRTVLRNIKFLCYFILSCFFMYSSCKKESENCHLKIRVENLSNNDIYFTSSYRYPDTLTLYPNPTLDPTSSYIEKKTYKNEIYRSCIEGSINSSEGNKIMYFIYDYSLLNSTPWDTVIKNYMVLKRYDLSLEDIQNMNWTITYP